MTKKTTKQATVHNDRVGRQINPGDIVATARSNTLAIMRVIESTPKMVKLSSLKSQMYTILKYPQDTVVIDSSDVTMYVLKNG